MQMSQSGNEFHMFKKKEASRPMWLEQVGKGSMAGEEARKGTGTDSAGHSKGHGLTFSNCSGRNRLQEPMRPACIGCCVRNEGKAAQPSASCGQSPDRDPSMWLRPG